MKKIISNITYFFGGVSFCISAGSLITVIEQLIKQEFMYAWVWFATFIISMLMFLYFLGILFYIEDSM